MTTDDTELQKQRAWAADVMNRKPLEQNAEQITANRDLVKHEYEPLYGQVLEILQRHDPVGIGYLADEYEPEVDTILLRLDNVSAEDDLRRTIYEEFVWWFSTAGAQSWKERLSNNSAGPESNYEEVAREIWHLLRSKG